MLAIIVPLSAFACSGDTQTAFRADATAGKASFVFGTQGGSVMPFTVVINAKGKVSAKGPIQVKKRQLSVKQLNTLLARAQSGGFFKLPKTKQCSGSLPDISARYISISTTAKSHQSTVHGTCLSSFNTLYTALMKATGATTASSPSPSGGAATIIFGREGGNIRPYTVTIAPDGTVKSNGAVNLASGHLSQSEIADLLQKAQAAGFFDMTETTQCPGTLPDVASLFVEIDSSSGNHRVSVHGGCVSSFNDLFSALEKATGAG
jgi:hypothetical protein